MRIMNIAVGICGKCCVTDGIDGLGLGLGDEMFVSSFHGHYLCLLCTTIYLGAKESRSRHSG